MAERIFKVCMWIIAIYNIVILTGVGFIYGLLHIYWKPIPLPPSIDKFIVVGMWVSTAALLVGIIAHILRD